MSGRPPLGIWVVVGAQKTLFTGPGWLPAILLGVVTAVGGGAVRDIALRRIPTVLGGNTLYATCALAAAAVVVVLQLAGRPTAWSSAPPSGRCSVCWHGGAD